MPGLTSHRHLYILFAILTVLLWNGCHLSPDKPSMRDRSPGKLPPSVKLVGRSIAWQEPTTTGLSGVALVIHGLNLKPSTMIAINATLMTAGIAVLQLSLQGHGHSHDGISNTSAKRQRMQLFKSVSHATWYGQALHAYHYAKKRSKKEGVPLFLVAYSFGGLLGTDLFASEPSVQFDKMVLFSPAFNVTFGYGLKWLFIFPRLVIPSFAPRDYRANWGTPIAAYRALFKTIDHFKTHLKEKVNIPTLIFIDPDDELVSYCHLKNLVRSEKLTQWRILPVAKSPSNQLTSPHHLIIDPASLGVQAWSKVEEKMTKHLLSGIVYE